MSKRLTVSGNIHYEPSGSLPGASGDQDLGLPGATLGKILDQTLELDGTPYVVVGPLPAVVVSVKVLSGLAIVTLSGAGGNDQVLTVSEYLYIASLTQPFTAVTVDGVAVVELLVGSL